MILKQNWRSGLRTSVRRAWKPQGDGRRVPWHEDSAYWKGHVEPLDIVTVWLTIDPSTEENGCMKVIPRTHMEGQKGYSNYDPVDASKHVFPTEITKRQRDESKAVSCILEPNHASLHDARIMHGSDPNHSTRRRCGYTMRFMSTASRLSEKQREHFQIYLARGRDLANQPENYGDPKVPAPELVEQRIAKGKRGH